MKLKSLLILILTICYCTENKSKTVFDFVNNFLDGDEKTNGNKSEYIVNLNDPNVQLEEWLTISSQAFKNNIKYPFIKLQTDSENLRIGDEYHRMNLNFEKAKEEGATTEDSFYFRIRSNYLYYTATKTDLNVLDAIYIKDIDRSEKKSTIGKKENSCLIITDYENSNWDICFGDEEVSWKWFCSILQKLGKSSPLKCGAEDTKAQVQFQQNKTTKVEIFKRKQPVIVIPIGSKNCNENWDYKNNGSDWECECQEGFFQSPIDLPGKETATNISPIRPLFNYDKVDSTVSESTIDGLLQAGDNVKIRNDQGAIRIYHPNMGKIVQLDGSVFIAEEISFHTPSEHTIDGQIFDMEMQIIHYGRSVGDISKQVVFSILFKSTPGAYNKFLDKLDFFSLPNPDENFRDITQDFFIPSVFYTTDDEDPIGLPPFSFYTYEGSITKPPCTERTTHYVVADPIPLSNTVIQLFKEALRKKERVNSDGTVISNQKNKNNRSVQPLNGRTVYLFDHVKYGCVEFRQKKKNVTPSGHYEKAIKTATEYIYVSGDKPSDLPGSFVVSENEAKGI